MSPASAERLNHPAATAASSGTPLPHRYMSPIRFCALVSPSRARGSSILLARSYSPCLYAIYPSSQVRGVQPREKRSNAERTIAVIFMASFTLKRRGLHGQVSYSNSGSQRGHTRSFLRSEVESRIWREGVRGRGGEETVQSPMSNVQSSKGGHTRHSGHGMAVSRNPG
jgi:hypothetical protein